MMTFDHVSVSLGGRSILSDISFPLVPHKITVLLGRNGSGKSTLVSCLTNLVRYTGEIRYGENPLALMSVRERAKLIASLPQNLPKTALTVEALAAMGRTPYLDLGRRLQAHDRQQIDEALEAVGMEELRGRPTLALSGGERQRAYLAMVLAQNTRIIALDEPTTYLDMENEALFLSLISKLKKERRKTILLVMHDLSKAVEIADNIFILQNGQKAFFGSSEEAVDTGIIETTFGVRRSSYERDGVMLPLYYR